MAIAFEFEQAQQRLTRRVIACPGLTDLLSHCASSSGRFHTSTHTRPTQLHTRSNHRHSGRHQRWQVQGGQHAPPGILAERPILIGQLLRGLCGGQAGASDVTRLQPT
eukprot:363197-Chlamydomonas_euryale.AAC.2